MSSIPPYPLLLSVSSHLTRVPTTHQRAGHCIVAIQHQCPLQLLSLHTQHISKLWVVSGSSLLDHTRTLLPTLPRDLPGGVGPAARRPDGPEELTIRLSPTFSQAELIRCWKYSWLYIDLSCGSRYIPYPKLSQGNIIFAPIWASYDLISNLNSAAGCRRRPFPMHLH